MRVRATGGAGTIAILLVLSAAGPVTAQSLAEIARMEAERRATVKVPGKVYTNADLIPDFTKPLPIDPAADPSSGAGAPADPAASTAASSAPAESADAITGEAQNGVTPRDQQEPQAADGRDESYWRDQAQLIRTRLANQNAQIEQLQARERTLAPDAGNAERALVQQTLQKAVADLAFLNDEWLRFERSARERRIPEHWIR